MQVVNILTDNALVGNDPYIRVQCWSGSTKSPPGLRQRARSRKPSAKANKVAKAPQGSPGKDMRRGQESRRKTVKTNREIGEVSRV